MPEGNAEAVRTAMGDAGAGRIGNYAHCSFSAKGAGRFLPLEGAQPAIGSMGKIEEAAEERIEVTCQEAVLTEACAAVRKAHPYEEPVIDIYPLFSL